MSNFFIKKQHQWQEEENQSLECSVIDEHKHRVGVGKVSGFDVFLNVPDPPPPLGEPFLNPHFSTQIPL